jgi:hypothetical protein
MNVLQIGFQKDIRSCSAWGAVERVIQGYDKALLDFCSPTYVTSNAKAMESSISNIKPDIIICHNEFVAKKALALGRQVNAGCKVKLVSHYAYLKEALKVLPFSQAIDLREKIITTKARLKGLIFWRTITDFMLCGGEFIAIDPRLCRALSAFGKTTYCHNYIYHDQYMKNDDCPRTRYICVGKIEARKRQAYLQSVSNEIDFYGPVADSRFIADQSYKGSIENDEVIKVMSTYAGLVLVSISELHALVTIEAKFAGLPLVLGRNSGWIYGEDHGCLILDDGFRQLPPIEYLKSFNYGEIRDNAIQKFSLSLVENRIRLAEVLLG